MLNNPNLQFATDQEQLVLILDSRLDFIEHMQNKINKCIKIICITEKRSLALAIKILVTKNNKNYTSLMLNDAKVQFASSQKHLLFILDSRFDFIEHIDNKINKNKQIIGMMKKTSLTQSRNMFLTIYNKNYPSLMLEELKMQFATTQKHLVLILVSRLDFIEYIDHKINKYKQIIGIMKKSSLTQSKKILVTVYNKNYPSLMLNDTKFQFENYTEAFSIDFKFKI